MIDAPESLRISELTRLVESGRAREIRLQARLSRATVAADLGVSPASVERWESGATHPRRADALRYLGLLRALEREMASRQGAEAATEARS